MHSHPISPASATRILAYIHHFSPAYYSTQLLSPIHLRKLANWIGFPMPDMRTARQNQILAMHLVLLKAADLLRILDSGHWVCTPQTFVWLKQPYTKQVQRLLNAADDDSLQLTAALEEFQLTKTLTIDYLAYNRQTLARQMEPSRESESATLTFDPNKDELIISIPQSLPPATTFHVLQLGEWLEPDVIRITPAELARAKKRGYSRPAVTLYLERAIGERLPPLLADRIVAWQQRQGRYRLEPVTLLRTKQPKQLANILANGRLRRHLLEQLGPRHAVVRPKIAPSLERWLEKRGEILESTPEADPPTLDAPFYSALATLVLADLATFVELPVSFPGGLADDLLAALPDEEQALVKAYAIKIQDGLQETIRGWDAYFPSDHPVPDIRLKTVTEAIAQEKVLAITYQSPADAEPRYRQVQPLRLEKRNGLYYLYAYCHRAENNLVFRVDRIHQMEPATSNDGNQAQ